METPAEHHLRAELEAVKRRLAELEATTNAIHSGEVDAIVVEGPHGPRLFTLQSPEEPYRLLAERMNEGAATLNGDGTILFCNRRLAEMVGLPAEQLVGSLFLSLLPEPEQSAFSKLMEQTFQHDVRTEGRLLRHDRIVIPVQLSFSAIPLEEPTRGICLVATDLTAQKLVEDQVRRLNSELEERVDRRTAELQAANCDLEAFSYAVAHDLRAPLRHIRGFSKILQDDAASTLSPEGRRCLQNVLDGSSRMEGMLEALLNFSRLGRQPVCRETISLNKIIAAIVDDLAPETVTRVIRWKVGELPQVHGDPALIKIVMVNLLSNALKYTRRRDKPCIEVGHQIIDGESVIFVRDNGVGFNMNYAGKLFGVFQRLHRQEDFEGTGVGLATAQRIIQKHGGRIWAEAAIDKGATFFFTLGKSQVNGSTMPAAAMAGQAQ